MELSLLNVKQYKADRMKQAEKLNPEQRSMRLMKEIQQELHLDRLPMQIECFDNSNIQGTDAVAACVVLKGETISDYRKYNIKTVVGADDYASMKEVVRRRYQRAIEEESPARPDYHRWRKRANGGGQTSNGRVTVRYSDCRTRQGSQTPYI